MQLEDYFDFQRSVLCPCSHSQVSRDTGLRVLLVVPAAHQENPAPNQCEISSGNLPRSNHRSSALVSISFSLVAIALSMLTTLVQPLKLVLERSEK